MPDRSLDNERPENTKRPKRLSWLVIAIVLAIVLCVLFLRVLLYESVAAKLAAIEAARVIPDSENAAILYNQALADYDESVFSAGFLEPAVDNLTRNGPWSSKDYPDLAEWLGDRQDTIAKLLQVSKMEKCRFPLPDFPEVVAVSVERTKAMRKWAFLLVRSANNDIAEGRIDQGLEKYICLIRIGRHNRQQPVAIDFLTGIALEALALSSMRVFLLQGDASEEHLQVIERALPQANGEWVQEWTNMIEVERLYARQLPMLDRLKTWWQRHRNEKATVDRMHEIYLRLLADRRGSLILIALRRHKDKTNRWPQSLDEIKQLVAEDILIDPQNDSSFVYKLTDDGFTLYSIGRNDIDEAGRYKGGADDWPIWPTRHMNSKTKEEDTDDR